MTKIDFVKAMVAEGLSDDQIVKASEFYIQDHGGFTPESLPNMSAANASLTQDGMLASATPEQRQAVTDISTPDSMELYKATGYYSNKSGLYLDPVGVNAMIRYEYGINATPQVANAENLKAVKWYESGDPFGDIRKASKAYQMEREKNPTAPLPQTIKAPNLPAWLGKRIDVARQWWEGISGSSAIGAEEIRAEPFRKKAIAGEIDGGVIDFFQSGGWDASMANRYSVAIAKGNRTELKALQSEDIAVSKGIGDKMDLSDAGLGAKIVKGAAGSMVPMIESIMVGGAAGTFVGPMAGKMATGAYWQQQGAGMFIRSYLKDKNIDTLTDEQIEQMNLVAQGMGVPYAAAELIVSSIPWMKALGSSVDQQIANAFFKKVLANPTLVQKIAKGSVAFGIRFLIESLVEESAQGGVDEATRQMLDKVEQGNIKALFDYDWSKIGAVAKQQGVRRNDKCNRSSNANCND